MAEKSVTYAVDVALPSRLQRFRRAFARERALGGVAWFARGRRGSPFARVYRLHSVLARVRVFASHVERTHVHQRISYVAPGDLVLHVRRVEC